MDYVLSLSYGKDSMACLGAIEQLGWPLTRIVTADIWATQDIPADPPPMVEFKKYADEVIKQRYGIKVEHFVATYAEGVHGEKVTFEDAFYRKMTSGKNIGRIKGFPMQKGNWCLKLKLNAIKQIEQDTKDCVFYVGIAADEPKRFKVLNDTKKSPLIEIGWTEADCKRWCEGNNLLSPIYQTSSRGGCWFCHNQTINQLKLLRKTYPDYWELMLKWDSDSPTTFKPNGHTVHDFDKRFSFEDAGLIELDKPFRWKILKEIEEL